ncbi:TonB-dependent receptor [Catenovulum sp. 2E275]|uniref:TonB-dependent receptor domain-containing protein n=1 Tax=Catenovulum sp. 2E275 TaxID=2980497 RepID=UPI0021D20597|nr:TonB-dependent receptor [Catenovulum sp. 2E275]MCU4676673.1 TonB-dependent receptor [Catenovulum sp. 2E275]
MYLANIFTSGFVISHLVLGRLIIGMLVLGMLTGTFQGKVFATESAQAQFYKIKLDADNLFTALTQLSQQTQIAVFFNPNLTQTTPADNQILAFQYAGQIELTDICKAIAAHYQVKIEVIENSIVVAKLPATQPALTTPRAVKLSQTQPITQPKPEEVIVIGSSEQSRQHRGYQSTQNAQPQNSVRVEQLSLLNAASYPTNNLAESLLTIAGISASYDGGEGRQLAIRGLSGDFLNISLNGMQTLAIHGSTLDSREQNERALAFDFNVLPAELFAQVNVTRDYHVSQDSGGIGSNIEIYSMQHDDLAESDLINIMFEQNYNALSEHFSYGSAINWQFKRADWYYQFAAVYKQKNTQEQGYNTYRWRTLDIGDTDISALNQQLQNQLNNQSIYFARGNRYSSWLNDIEQLGLTASAYYITENIAHKFDWVSSQLTNQKREYHLATRGINTTAISQDNLQLTGINKLTIDQHNFVEYAEFSNAQLATETRLLQKETEFNQVTWSGEYQPKPSIDINWLIGHAQNRLSIPQDQKVYLTAFSDLTTDYQANPNYPINLYSKDVSLAETWQLDEIDLQKNTYLIRQNQAKIQFNYQMLNTEKTQSQWQFGLQYKDFYDQRRAYQQADLLKAEFASGRLDNNLQANFYLLATQHKKQAFAAVDISQIMAAYLPQNQFTEEDILIADSYALNRQNRSAWLSYQYQHTNYRFDIGVRYESLKNQLTATDNTKLNHKQDNFWLLSANFRYQINQNWQARVNLSQNFTPVQTKYMTPAQVYLSALDIYQTGSADLSAYKSTQLSAQLSATPTATTELISGIYYKKLSGLINYQQTVWPTLADNTQPQAVESAIFSPTGNQNGWLFGSDLSWYWHLTTNVSLQAAYSYADSSRTYQYGDLYQHQAQIEGMSDHTAQLSLNYHTQNWGSRFNLNYRSDYISEIKYSRLGQDQLETGFLPYARLNWSAYFKLTPEFEINLGINNLSNAFYREYAGQHQHLYNTTETGRQFYLRVLLQI